MMSLFWYINNWLAQTLFCKQVVNSCSLKSKQKNQGLRFLLPRILRGRPRNTKCFGIKSHTNWLLQSIPLFIPPVLGKPCTERILVYSTLDYIILFSTFIKIFLGYWTNQMEYAVLGSFKALIKRSCSILQRITFLNQSIRLYRWSIILSWIV